MSLEKQSGITDLIPYPQGILKALVRFPMLFHQMGIGFLLRPMRLMTLTTEGRTSGLARHTILEYRRHGSKLYVISGWGDKPHWVKNVMKNPEVTVQFGQRELGAKASVVNDSAESLRALYMFQRTGRIYEVILANMSNAESIDLRKLKLVADQFTVVRFDLHKNPPRLRGIQPENSVYPFVVISTFLTVVTGLLWIIASRFNHSNKQDSIS